MLFISYEYMFFFLPVTLAVYYALNRSKLIVAAKGWLVCASLFFYSWWNVKYLVLIIGSILFNFILGTMIERINVGKGSGLLRKVALISGVAVNLALLGYYKYADFFITNVNTVFDTRLSLQRIILPLGISFFTFTQIAFLVDIYGGKVKEYKLLNYSLFVTFFPHLLAGPIIHHREMMPQFDSMKNKLLNYKNLSAGIYLFCMGLFKKVVIADALAPVASFGFDKASALTLIESWVTSVSFTLQLYFDFSAYTDMALGAALMFNIRLPFNFNSPYKACDIADFWRRWHMTLSRFLRDYIYIPLGGNRNGRLKTYRNLMVTFLLGGIWHGAGWPFLFWGFLHGAATVIHRFWSRLNVALPRALAWFLTFNFVNIAWIFFRAKTWGDAIKVLKGMSGLGGVMLSESYAKKMSALSAYGITFGNMFYRDVEKNAISIIIFSFLIAVFVKNSDEIRRKFEPNWKTAIFTIGIWTYALLSMYKVSEFLYFNF